MSLFDQKYIRHVVAVFILIIVAAVYFFPETQGKKILSHDQVSAVAASKQSRDYQEIFLLTHVLQQIHVRQS